MTNGPRSAVRARCRNAAPFLVTAMLALIPAAARSAPAADVCRTVPRNVVRVLLFGDENGTLDSNSQMRSGGNGTCVWVARIVPTGETRRMWLDITRLPSVAMARSAVAGSPDDMQSDAIAAGADDQVRRLSPFRVRARHGVTIATLDAADAKIAGPPRAARFWLDVAALSAAGATVQDRRSDEAGAAPALADAAASSRWIPPPHDAGSAGRMLAPLIVTIKLLADWRFVGGVVLFLGCLVALSFATRQGPLRFARPPILAFMAYLFVNVGLGPGLADWLIYRFGTAGAGTVVSDYATSTQYNDKDVVGFNVLIRTPDRQVLEAGFRTDSFNVYPHHNLTSYPGVGDQFTVRYPPGHPRRFVIVADDGSPWARSMRCDALRSADAAIRRRADFAASAAPQVQRQIESSARALLDAGC